MAILVIIFIAVSVFAGVYVFLDAKDRLGLPTFANVPGAFLVAMSVLELSAWLSYRFGLFDGAMGLSPMEEIPWYACPGYLMAGVMWYYTVFLVKRMLANMQHKEQRGATREQ